MSSKKKTAGMVLGKFLPPHLGHVYLVETARGLVDELTVVVGTLAAEPIAGELRYAWMRELCGTDVNVVHLVDELPQDPSEHPDFWALWQASLTRVLPSRPDFVFASEDYGWKLAEVLGARFFPVDRARSAVPVSGTAIRDDPFGHFAYLPRPVRPYFVRRVSVFGPESTGKSTLTRKLAEHYRTTWVPEYARTLIEMKGGTIGLEDMETIARGQAASEDALARNADRVLFCDTDPLATRIWSDTLYGEVPEIVSAVGRARRYALTLLNDVDVPWVEDIARYLPEERASFFDRCRAELEAAGRSFVHVRGSWEERFRLATDAVDAMLAEPWRPS